MPSCITGLGGKVIAFTYPGLIKTADNFNLPTICGGDRGAAAVFCNENKTGTPNALVRLSDGEGNPGSFALGQTSAGAKVFGPLIVDGSDCCNFKKVFTVVNGGAEIEGNLCVCGTNCNKIGGTSCLTQLHVSTTSCLVGDTTIDSNLCVKTCTTINNDLTVDTNTLKVDASTNRVGINKGSPSVALDVVGATCITGALTVGGEIKSCSDITAFFTSDRRLKNNIIKIDNSNEVINKISGYTYDWDEKSGKEGEGVGVIAQEVQEFVPSAVRENQNGYLSVDYIKLIPYLIEEVKSLNNRIQTLEAK